MILEHAPFGRRGFYASFALQGVQAGQILAAAVFLPLAAYMPTDAFNSWGWRIPFLIGAILSLYGLYIRIGLPETPHFVAVEQQRAVESRPILRALKDHPWESFVVFAMQMGTVQFYIWTVFLPTYTHLAGGLPLGQGLIGGVISLAVFCVVTPAAGALSDRIGRRPLLIAYAIGYDGAILRTSQPHPRGHRSPARSSGRFPSFLTVNVHTFPRTKDASAES